MKYRLKIVLFFVVFLIALRPIAFSEDLTWNSKVLPNGFTIAVKEVHSHPSCSVHLFVAVGSSYENPRINGISHFYEHLFFKGTKRRTSTQMKAEMENYGGDINGATYRDYTEFIVNVPSLYVDKAIDMLMDAFLNATFDPVEMEKERKVVLDEVSLDAANPERNLGDVFDKDMYTVHPYRMPIAGNPDSVKRVSRDDIVHWKQNYYVPSNAFLVVSGDVDTAKINAQVADLLKDAPKTPYTPPVFPKEPEKTRPLVRQTSESVSQAILQLGYMVTGLDTPEDIYPLDVMTFMLGYGRASILTRELKDKDHLVDEISADFLTQRYPSTFQVSAVCKPDQVDTVRRKILEMIMRIKKGDIDESEIARAKTFLNGFYTLGNQTNAGIVGTIGFYVTMGAGDFPKHYLSNIQKVTAKDMVRVAQKYFQDNYVETIFVPKSPPPGSHPQ